MVLRGNKNPAVMKIFTSHVCQIQELDAQLKSLIGKQMQKKIDEFSTTCR